MKYNCPTCGLGSPLNKPEFAVRPRTDKNHDEICINMTCEDGHNYDLIIEFHKGDNYITTRSK